MALKRMLFFISLVIVSLILMLDFYLSGQQALAAAVLLPVGLIISALRWFRPILAHISLAGFTILTAVGAILNSGMMVMVFALLAAVASWDLILELLRKTPTTGSYDNLHLKYLGIALGFGLLGTGIGQLIHLQFPFVVLLLSGVAIVVLLDQLLSYFLQDKEANR